MALPQALPMNDLASALANVNPTTASEGGTQFLTFSGNTGEYLVGRDKELMDGEKVLVNIPATAKGWTCWSGGQPNKVLINYFTEELPPQPAPIGSDAYSESRAIQVRTLDGEVEAVMEGNSYGMRKAVDTLLIQVKQRAMDPACADSLYPVITLDTESYKHKTGKQVYNPVFTVVGWADANGNIVGDTPKLEAEEPAAETPAPKRRRRNTSAQ